MKYKGLFILVIFACIQTSLLVFSGAGLSGAIHGLNLSYSVIIPSLFPFTVCSLIIFECGFIEKCEDFLYKRNIKLNILELSVYLISLLGGFPVGAKLIEKLYSKGEISKINAQLLLAFCVNSGPAFIIIAIGKGVLNNAKLGYVLFASNIISTIIIFIIIKIFMKQNHTNIKRTVENRGFADIFVSSTYDATQSMLVICAFVVLFSTIISIVNEIWASGLYKNIILSLLEISNGITLIDKNIYLIAFLLGFSGVCVHFQVLSMCSKIKPNYPLFFGFRVLHGIINVITTKIIVKLFKINISAISVQNDFTYMFSKNSYIFGAILILLSVVFICSVSKQNNI